MMRRLALLTSFILTLFLLAGIFGVNGTPVVKAASLDTQNLTQYVNTFSGTTAFPSPSSDIFPTDASGNVFPGADDPLGMVQWSPDTTSGLPGGNYQYNSNTITGFSLTHWSGPGCFAVGDIPFMPYVGSLSTSPGSNWSAYSSTFSHSNESASPGYYSVLLDGPKVKTELSVTPRTGFGQFTYPASSSSTLLINTSGSRNGVSASSVTIDNANNLITGSATSGNFCYNNGPYTIYFAAQFVQGFSGFGTWNGSNVNANSTSSNGTQSGAYVTFDTTQNAAVQVKVGVSFVSVDGAKANLNAENSGNDFNAVRSAANTSWNNVLNQIQVSGGSDADTQTFYTSLYHSLLFPSIFSDVDGSYIGFDNTVHNTGGRTQYAVFSGWDIYHSQIPLLALLLPGQTSDMMQSLVNDYSQSGCLPKWSVYNYHTDVQDGDSADPIIAEAYAFGATNFDTKTALQAMIKGATQPCTTGAYTERPGGDTYQGLGYVPYGTPNVTGTASATLEYATDDFAISRFAHALGDGQDETIFSVRAQNWENEYNASTGFIEPRNSDGSFIAGYNHNSQNNGDFQEGSAYQYTWAVPFNLQGLFNRLGGNSAVVSRLNTFFTKLNDGGNSSYAWLGNEPSTPSPWEYDFAGQPSGTQEVVREEITQLFNASPGGIPGNDDLGQTSSTYVFGALGFFPLYPGEGDVVLGSPLFPSATITLGNGKQVQITGNGAADNAPYVQSLQVNGQDSTQLWQPYSTLANGATLAFTLGTTATSWGTNAADAPPSFDAENGLSNIGIGDDNQSSAANFDGSGYSYSRQALQAAGITAGQTVSYNGVNFTWPNAGSGGADNYLAQGQTVGVSATDGATTLAFLGAANNGPSQGTATIHYTDGSTQDFNLGFSDWTLGGNTAQPSFNNGTVATTAMRDSNNGAQQVSTYVFYTDVALQGGKTVQSVTLPSFVNQGRIHVFALATK